MTHKYKCHRATFIKKTKLQSLTLMQLILILLLANVAIIANITKVKAKIIYIKAIITNFVANKQHKR